MYLLRRKHKIIKYNLVEIKKYNILLTDTVLNRDVTLCTSDTDPA